MRSRPLVLLLTLLLATGALPVFARPAWHQSAEQLLDTLTRKGGAVLPFELAPPSAPADVVATLGTVDGSFRLWVRNDGELVLETAQGIVRERPLGSDTAVVAGPPSPTVVRRYVGPPDQWQDPVPTA